MSVVTVQYNLSSTPVKICDADPSRIYLSIQFGDNTYIGNSTVDDINGHFIRFSTEKPRLNLRWPECTVELWARGAGLLTKMEITQDL